MAAVVAVGAVYVDNVNNANNVAAALRTRHVALTTEDGAITIEAAATRNTVAAG